LFNQEMELVYESSENKDAYYNVARARGQILPFSTILFDRK